jgi:hypothetical protein
MNSKTQIKEKLLKRKYWVISQECFSLRDFYFRALRSLVVLSFPQLVSFSSVFPKPLSETLKSSDGRIPVKLTVSVLTCGATSCGAASRGAGRKGPRGTGRDRVWLYVRARFCLPRAKLALTFRSAFFPSLSVNSSLSFHQISIKSREASISIFLQWLLPFGPHFLPNMVTNLEANLEASIV